ncbi:MAG: type II secretion system major pseudopilin GspG [Armatimonadetes bacterium]|nr:type II secretion system major pseudopilin GspG [Armatimonadota bacterium]MDW8121009.1 type II secretion system major pseudopilin GspG [Armatimonadota bacterium]
MKGPVHAGWTLLELVVVMVILALLASIASVYVVRRIEDGRRTKALMDLESISQALDQYYADMGSYPTTEEGLEALIVPPSTAGRTPTRWGGPYLKGRQVPIDSWGNPYAYSSDGETYELFSLGKDGRANTADDVRPVDE